MRRPKPVMPSKTSRCTVATLFARYYGLTCFDGQRRTLLLYFIAHSIIPACGTPTTSEPGSKVPVRVSDRIKGSAHWLGMLAA